MDEIKKNIYSSRVLAAVGRLSGQKAPEVALRRDIIRVTGLPEAELDEVLADLLERGFIETGRTINDTFIRLKN